MRFVVAAWAISRLIVAVAFVSSTGHPVAALSHWDGAWYASIANHGYSYARDGARYNVAFFPLFPLLVRPLLSLGIGWPLAAAFISNAAFFGTLVVLADFARTRYDERTARWCVAFAALLPPSLFCSVDYPQSLFMLASGAALFLAARRRWLYAGIAGAFASASSGLGIALVAAFVAAGIATRDRKAVLAGALAAAGVGAFVAYCAWRFGDPLAFVRAQAAWRHAAGFDLTAWRRIILSLATIQGIRQNAMMLLVPLGAAAVALNARALGALPATFALVGIAVLAFAGTPFSVDRNTYALVPVVIAIGACARRVQPAGYVALAACALLLAIDASRFARFEWVA